MSKYRQILDKVLENFEPVLFFVSAGGGEEGVTKQFREIFGGNLQKYNVFKNLSKLWAFFNKCREILNTVKILAGLLLRKPRKKFRAE